MNVKVIEEKSGKVLNAKILPKDQLKVELPSFIDGWRFDFKKHSKKKNYQTFVLCCIDNPDIIEGCLIFEMKNSVEPSYGLH